MCTPVNLFSISIIIIKNNFAGVHMSFRIPTYSVQLCVRDFDGGPETQGDEPPNNTPTLSRRQTREINEQAKKDAPAKKKKTDASEIDDVPSSM